MKISKKTVAALCIIVPILALSAFITWSILYVNQQPNFSKYHSYAVKIENGIVPLTDEQFRQIAQGYINEETLRVRGLLEDAQRAGHVLYLYKSDDMSGEHDIMRTGAKAGTYAEICLFIDDRAFRFSSDRPINIVNEIIAEAINQSESEQEL
ncbi:MAG: hypothetical protein K2N71_10470 [Oscillospiraceae bacterium]|nr:hypothetical protein [Oscillospiraceae bacterium]